MDVKAQEYKFVEWSHGISAETDDVRELIARLAGLAPPVRVLDVGGGIGTVAAALAEALPGAQVDVVEPSELARRQFVVHPRVQLLAGDFLTIEAPGAYDAVVFRTVLHHIVGPTERRTTHLQQAALKKASTYLTPRGCVFVTENFYEPVLGWDLTGALIFQLTALKRLAFLFRRLGANTAGEGVRFRSALAWKRMFATAGLHATAPARRTPWAPPMPWWQRWPLLCRERYQASVALVNPPASHG